MSRRAEQGFTLVEVVVALTLLALLLFGMVSALRSFGQTGTRLEQQTLANDDLRLVSSLLQRAISRSSARVRADGVDQLGKGWFQGGASELVWLGHLPARHGVGGLTHLRLFVTGAGEEGGGRLMLQMAPFAGDDQAPDWALLEPRILLEGVDALSFQYQGRDETGELFWFETWDEAGVLPVLVQMLVVVRGRPWPPVVIALEQTVSRRGLGGRTDRVPLRWR